MNLRDQFDIPVPTIVLAEGEFGERGGKTANGVVMHSKVFDVRAVVDSETVGSTVADILAKADAPDIPIVKSFEDAIKEAPKAEALVIGVAPAGGKLPDAWTEDIEKAIHAGCDIVSGLHVFLSDDEYWSSLANKHHVRIFDVRKPPADEELHVGDGSVDEIDAKIVLTLGTDCAVGKRTTTFELYEAACKSGWSAGWVATGQTGIMVGAHEGIVVDRVPADFTNGVVEDMVKAVARDHDIVFVEGQASLTHRAYSSVTLAILHGAWPDAVVLADEPDRTQRTHFERFSVDGIKKEKRIIEELSDATVAAISTWGDPNVERKQHELPAANIYEENGPNELLEAVENALGVHV